MSIAVLADDAALPQGSFTGGQWDHQNGQSSFLGGTVSTCRVRQPSNSNNDDDDDDDEDKTQSLIYSFVGSDVSVYGTFTPGLTMSYSLDGSAPAPAQLASSNPGKPGVQLFSISGLSKTDQHKLQLFPTSGQFVFDYFSSTATPSTNLTSTPLVVDDHSPLVKYSTGWTNAMNVQYPTGNPYLMTATGSSLPGSSLTFQFTGSSISVIGATQKANGSLTASFSVDGRNPVKFNPFDGSQNVNASQWTVAQTLFQQDVQPGNHTLTVTLDAVTGAQVLWIDAFVFKGTNETVLLSSPLNPLSPLSPLTPGDVTPGDPNVTPGNYPEGHSSRKLPGGAIAGIIIALLVALPLLGILIWKWRDRNTPRFGKDKVFVDLTDTHPQAGHPAVVMEEIPKMDEFMHARVQAAYRVARQRQHNPDPSFDSDSYPIPEEETSALPRHSLFDSPSHGTRFSDPDHVIPVLHNPYPTASQEKAWRNAKIMQWNQATVRNQSEDIPDSIVDEIAATAALHAPVIAPVSTSAYDIPPALMPGRTRAMRDEELGGSSTHLNAYSFGSSTIPPPAYDFTAVGSTSTIPEK